jgi:hypothetical protein
MLDCKIQYLIRYSDQVPKRVSVCRPMFPWELWADRSSKEYGNLKLLSGLSYGSEDSEKFSEPISLVVSDYTEAEAESLRLAIELGLIC